MRQRVSAGLPAWAAWGDTGWRCVRVLSVGRKFVKIQRENPRTGEIIARRGKARIAEMVKRDPRQRGRDKPGQTPAEMFAQQRAPEPPPPAPPPRQILGRPASTPGESLKRWETVARQFEAGTDDW
jgi:hypothetical protein